MWLILQKTLWRLKAVMASVLESTTVCRCLQKHVEFIIGQRKCEDRCIHFFFVSCFSTFGSDFIKLKNQCAHSAGSFSAAVAKLNTYTSPQNLLKKKKTHLQHCLTQSDSGTLTWCFFFLTKEPQQTLRWARPRQAWRKYSKLMRNIVLSRVWILRRGDRLDPGEFRDCKPHFTRQWSRWLFIISVTKHFLFVRSCRESDFFSKNNFSPTFIFKAWNQIQKYFVQ